MSILMDNSTQIPDEIEMNRSAHILLSDSNAYLNESSTFLTFLITIECSIFLVGLIGNIIVCAALAFNKSMHTTANCYLSNLSISDLLLLMTGVPKEIYSIYSPSTVYLGSFGCGFNNWASETSAFVSMITITVLAIERYVAMCHPFYNHTRPKCSRAIKYIIAIWIFSCICGYVSTAPTELVKKDDGQSICEFDPKDVIVTITIITVIYFITSLIIIPILYLQILLGQRRSNQFKRESQIRVNRNAPDDSTGRTIKMIVAVWLAFIICWSPFHVQRTMAVFYDSVSKDYHEVYDSILRIFNDISGIFYLLSTVANPIIYTIMSINFRKLCKKTKLFVNRSGARPRVYLP